MKVLIVCPFRLEARLLFPEISSWDKELVAGVWICRKGMLAVVESGQGKAQTAAVLSACLCSDKWDAALLFGTACGLAGTPPGTLVLGSACVEADWCNHEKKRPYFTPDFAFSESVKNAFQRANVSWRDGKILSADGDLKNAWEKSLAGHVHGALAQAWEGAGFYRALRLHGIVGVESRLVVDSTDTPDPKEFRKMCCNFAPLVKICGDAFKELVEFS